MIRYFAQSVKIAMKDDEIFDKINFLPNVYAICNLHWQYTIYINTFIYVILGACNFYLLTARKVWFVNINDKNFASKSYLRVHLTEPRANIFQISNYCI